jgi:hypothetical protein
MVNLRSKENKYKGHQQGQRGKEPLTKFLEFYKLEGPLTRVLGYYEVEKALWGLGNYTMSYAGRVNSRIIRKVKLPAGDREVKLFTRAREVKLPTEVPEVRLVISGNEQKLTIS